ncbi:MobA/MobL family protein, partial [Pseudomonas savastanoi]|uniref:MobA/MobL family protein n=1 Tax=Pseudomonas savastanoi TaxID=29438 RepID=UPI00287B8C67
MTSLFHCSPDPENAGSDARIDSRSLKAQGLDREATMHLGPVASDMERRGKASDRGDGNRQVAVNRAACG